MEKRLRSAIKTLFPVIGILALIGTSHAEVSIQGTTAIGNNQGTETINGSYDPTQGEIINNIKSSIEGGEGNLSCNIVMPILGSEYSDCHEVDLDGDGYKDLVVRRKYSISYYFSNVQYNVYTYSPTENKLIVKNIVTTKVKDGWRTTSHVSIFDNKYIFAKTAQWRQTHSDLLILTKDKELKHVINLHTFRYDYFSLRAYTGENGEPIFLGDANVIVDEGHYDKYYLFTLNNKKIYIGYGYSYYEHVGYDATNGSYFLPISYNDNLSKLDEKLKQEFGPFKFAFFFSPAKYEKPYIGIVDNNDELHKFYFDKISLYRGENIGSFWKIGSVRIDKNGLLITKEPDRHDYMRDNLALTKGHVFYVNFDKIKLDKEHGKVDDNSYIYKTFGGVLEFFAKYPLPSSITKYGDYYILTLGITSYVLNTDTNTLQQVGPIYTYRSSYYGLWVDETNSKSYTASVGDYDIYILQASSHNDRYGAPVSYYDYIYLYNKKTGELQALFENGANIKIKLGDKYFILFNGHTFIYDIVNNKLYGDDFISNKNVDLTISKPSYIVRVVGSVSIPRRSWPRPYYYGYAYAFKYYKDEDKLEIGKFTVKYFPHRPEWATEGTNFFDTWKGE